MARERVFDRLPEIWKALDLTQGGVLQRFLGLWDQELDAIHDKTALLMWTQNVDDLPDGFLPLLATRVGHVWRSDKSRDWNRRRIRYAIDRWSYKGTVTAIGDTLTDYGITQFSIVDMASKLIVFDKQADLSTENCYFQSADFYHDGAFVLTIPMIDDMEGLLEDLQDFRQAGTRWYVRIEIQSTTVAEDAYTLQLRVAIKSTNAADYGLDQGSLSDDFWMMPINAGPLLAGLSRKVNIHLFVLDGGSCTMSGTEFRMGDQGFRMSAGRGGTWLSEALAILQQNPLIHSVITMADQTVTMDDQFITMDCDNA